MRGGTVTAGEAVSLSVISSSRDCSCCCVFSDEVRLLGREEEGERLRFRPRGAGVVAAGVAGVVVVAEVVGVVAAEEEGGGSGS